MWAQLCPALCDPMDCGPPGSSMEFSRQEYWSGLLFPPPGESSWPRDRTHVSSSPALVVAFFPAVPPGTPSLSWILWINWTFRSILGKKLVRMLGTYALVKEFCHHPFTLFLVNYIIQNFQKSWIRKGWRCRGRQVYRLQQEWWLQLSGWPWNDHRRKSAVRGHFRKCWPSVPSKQAQRVSYISTIIK